MPKLSPIWQHLPTYFKKDVVSCLDFKSRVRLQLCSRTEQDLVKSCPVSIDRLLISYSYHENGNSFVILTINIGALGKMFVFRDIQNFINTMSRSLFVHPKSNCDLLSFDTHGPLDVSMISELRRALNVPIRVTSLRISSLENGLMDLIGLMDPDHLKMLNFDRDNDLSRRSCDQLVDSEHWEKLKAIRIMNSRVTFNLRDFVHLQRVCVYQCKCSLREAKEFIESFRSRVLPINSYFNIDLKPRFSLSEFIPNAVILANAKDSCLQRVSYPLQTEGLVLNVQFNGIRETGKVMKVCGCVEGKNEESDDLETKVYELMDEF